MKINEVDLKNKSQVKEFIKLPFSIYKGNPLWVPPLENDEKKHFDRKRHPFYRHSEAAFFLASQDGVTKGRLVIIDPIEKNKLRDEATAHFGMFECANDLAAATELFRAGLNWATKRGLKKMIGPKGFTALDGLGLLVKGFERRPAFGLPYNPPYYGNLIESQGFQAENDIVSGYLSSSIDFPERVIDLAEMIKRRRNLRILHFHNRIDLFQAIKYLKELYNQTLQETGGVPLSDNEIKAMANQLLWFADPELIKIVMKGEKPVGFLLAYPDISAGMQKARGRLFPFGWFLLLKEMHHTDWININGMGIVEEYRGKGGTAILFSELYKSITQNRRYRHAEVVQIGMENEKMQREMANFGIDFYKVHRMYQRDI